MSDNSQKEVRKVILSGALVNVALAGGKFTAGWFFGSRALMADAIDSLSDLVSDVITMLAYPLARKPADKNHPYGHGRIESLAAIFVAILLFAAALTLGWKSTKNLLSGNFLHPTWPALVVALLALSTKEWLFRWTLKVAKKYRSKVLTANAWHHRSDAFSSIAVTLGIIGSLVIPGAKSLDSLASLLVVVFIIRASFIIALGAINDLLDTVQDEEFNRKVINTALEVEGVQHAHRVRTRRYGHLCYVDLDIEVDENISVRASHNLSHDVKDLIIERFEFVADVLIHVEPEGDHTKGEGNIRLE